MRPHPVTSRVFVGAVVSDDYSHFSPPILELWRSQPSKKPYLYLQLTKTNFHCHWINIPFVRQLHGSNFGCLFFSHFYLLSPFYEGHHWVRPYQHYSCDQILLVIVFEFNWRFDLSSLAFLARYKRDGFACTQIYPIILLSPTPLFLRDCGGERA